MYAGVVIPPHPKPSQIRIPQLLTALGHPIRLEIARILDEGGEHNCTLVGKQLGAVVSKSTLTHHWRVLRESGLIWQRPVGREYQLTLRRKDLDARYPGLLDTVFTGYATDGPTRS